MIRSALHYLHHLYFDDPGAWKPLLAAYYLTYQCNFRCPYCSDGHGVPYFRLESPDPSGRQAVSILRAMHRHCGYVVITGGEPLLHPDAGFVLGALPRLGFTGVILTTNGYDMGRFLPLMAEGVDHLVVSLDTLDRKKADRWFGRGAGTLDKILDNLEKARARKRKRYAIHVSSVVTPGNAGDLYAVYGYARKRGFGFAACPQLLGVRAHPGLAQDPEYRRFYDFLISEKKRGQRITGSVPYLEHMRDFSKFRCRPFTMLSVAPDGTVSYPCLEMGLAAGNILHTRDLGELRRLGQSLHGPPPECGNQCHSACALSFSLMIERPWSLAYESLLLAKGMARGF